MKDLTTVTAELQELRAKLRANRSATETARSRLDGLQLEEAQLLNQLDALSALVGEHLAQIRSTGLPGPEERMGGAPEAHSVDVCEHEWILTSGCHSHTATCRKCGLVEDDTPLVEPLRAPIEHGLPMQTPYSSPFGNEAAAQQLCDAIANGAASPNDF